MYDIAQLYALRLNKLYDRNLMTAPAEPAVGQIVLLSGRRDRKPILRRVDKQQQAIVHIPTSLLVEEKDKEEEYIEWEEASTSVEHSTPMIRPTRTKPIVAPTHPEPMAKPIVPAPRYKAHRSRHFQQPNNIQEMWYTWNITKLAWEIAYTLSQDAIK